MVASNGNISLAHGTSLDESAYSALNNNTNSTSKVTSLLHSLGPPRFTSYQRANHLLEQSDRPPEVVDRSQEATHDAIRTLNEKTPNSSSQSGLKLALSNPIMIGTNTEINNITGTRPTLAPLYPPTAAALISSSTMSTYQANNVSGEYATVNYNGLIGINATDPLAISTESRIFSLPIGVQVSL